MSLLTVLKISVTLSRKELFSKVGFQVGAGDKIGLVGPNGSGKTTLLRLLDAEIQPDEGEIRMAKGARIGYLPQDIQESLSGPLLQSVIDSVPKRLELEKRLKKAEQALEGEREPGAQERIAEALTELHQKIQTVDTQFPPHGAQKILVGLGFQESEFTAPVSDLSGGWKTRAALASLLYQSPDLLLLDEPTNHLDIPSVHWLEQFLSHFEGAMILVSHDRDLVNRQVNRIISLESEGMRFHSGNYDYYLEAREEEKRTLAAKAKKQEQKKREAQRFIDRFRAKASKARQAQSKIKLTQKMELVKTPKRMKTIRFSFPDVHRGGKEVLTLNGVSKAFGDKILYADLHLSVLRGERIAVIGPNGCGKTTLLRMIAHEMRPDDGEISTGHEVMMSYYAQHHSEMLNSKKTVIQEVSETVPNETQGFVRNVCGAFLFSGPDVEKIVGILSGGEKARVSLAKLLVKPGNFMVMDEPTNHLDITSSEMLIQALAGYKGTLLFVSHNQSFVNRLATKIWDIREGEILDFPGNLDEYYDRFDSAGLNGDAGENHLSKKTARKPENVENQNSKDFQGKGPSRKDLKREKAERRRHISEALNPIKARLSQMEEEIGLLESREKELGRTLADPELFKDKDKGVPLLKEYHDVKDRLNILLEDWEHWQHKLESVKRDLGL